MPYFYIGLMSGTSMDAIDAVLMDFQDIKPRLVATHAEPLPDFVKRNLAILTQVSWNEIDRLGRMDNCLAELFANTVLKLICKANIPKGAIRAIGSHGQTIRHSPKPPYSYTLQIGDPNRIAKKTGIVTVGDFRRADMALGGEGAPLVPAFHQALAQNNKTAVGLNLGGIANVSLLSNEPLLGFDTGPANTLLDCWI